MILGMTLSTFTLFHVVLSLLGIASGLIVVYGLISGKRLDNWTAFFLVTTVLTSATGFLFPFEHLLPSHIVGMLSLLILAVAIVARYPRRLEGGWRRIYVICAMVALYLNCFVLIAQLFLKVPALHALAPKGNEPPFLIAQLVLMAVFVFLTIIAVKRFKELPLQTASSSTGLRAKSPDDGTFGPKSKDVGGRLVFSNRPAACGRRFARSGAALSLQPDPS